MPTLAFNNNSKQPRNSSTNTRALSTRIAKLEQEITPRVQISGTPVAASGVTRLRYLKRRIMIEAQLTSGLYTLTGAELGSKTFGAFPDGAKILKMVVMNRTGRNLIVQVPAATRLFNRGIQNDEVQAIRRTEWAPLSRFPKMVVDVPDTLANAIDTNDSVFPLIEVRSADLATSSISINIHYLSMV